MNELKKAFEKALSDLNTIDWSETDGQDIKEILKTNFNNISSSKSKIKSLIESYTHFNKYQKYLTVKLLEEC